MCQRNLFSLKARARCTRNNILLYIIYVYITYTRGLRNNNNIQYVMYVDGSF